MPYSNRQRQQRVGSATAGRGRLGLPAVVAGRRACSAVADDPVVACRRMLVQVWWTFVVRCASSAPTVEALSHSHAAGVDLRVVHPVPLAVDDVVADLHVLEDLRDRQADGADHPGRPALREQQHGPAAELEGTLGLDDLADVGGVGSPAGVEDLLAESVQLAAERLDLLRGEVRRRVGLAGALGHVSTHRRDRREPRAGALRGRGRPRGRHGRRPRGRHGRRPRVGTGVVPGVGRGVVTEDVTGRSVVEVMMELLTDR